MDAGSLDVSLKIRIVQSTLLAMSTSRTVEAPVPEIVDATLDALAAQEQAPLDQVA